MNKESINYRLIRPDDIEILTEIYQESFGPEKTGDNWSLETSRAHLQEVFENLNDQYCFIAEYESKVFGYAFAYEVNMEEGKELLFDIIAVRPEAQGMGIGTTLWEMVMTNVKKNNLTAVRLISSPKMPSYQWYMKKGMKESDWVELIIRKKDFK